MSMRTRKETCKECPFIRGCAPGWLGPHSTDEIMAHFSFELSFSCHMERTRKTTPEDVGAGRISICRGFLASANKSGKRFRNKRLFDLQEKVKSEGLEVDEEVLAQWDFVDYHNLKKANL